MTAIDIEKLVGDASQYKTILPVISDINGVFRGKRLAIKHARKVFDGGVKLPLATAFVDIWGRDVIGSGEVLETGDVDGNLVPTGRGVVPVDWLPSPYLLAPVSFQTATGEPYLADARNLLSNVVQRFEKKGLTPVCATELEFYVFDPMSVDAGLRAPNRSSIGAPEINDMYSVENLNRYSAFLDDVYAACEKMNVPLEAAISENGPGQFELNLLHGPDAVKCADDAVLFKFAVKGIARKHGFGATFMAKPYGAESGSGFHTHFSILNKKGENIFSNGADDGSPSLRWAIQGLIDAMPASMLMFAPHANSYRRFRDETHAPVNASWGYDNRTAAIRVPSSPDAARRIEHRVAGADANPYVVLAAILGAALNGIEAAKEAQNPLEGNAYAGKSPKLPTSWREAIVLFEASPFAEENLSGLFAKVFAAGKRQEYDAFAEIVPRQEYDAYLETL